MLKNIWQKIKQNHMLIMILFCLAPIVLIISLNAQNEEGSNSWTWLIILLCPLAHILMMAGHNHGDKHEKEMEEKEENQGKSEHSKNSSCH